MSYHIIWDTSKIDWKLFRISGNTTSVRILCMNPVFLMQRMRITSIYVVERVSCECLVIFS